VDDAVPAQPDAHALDDAGPAQPAAHAVDGAGPAQPTAAGRAAHDPAGRPAASGDPLFDPSDLPWSRVSPKLSGLWQVAAAIAFGPASLAAAVALVVTGDIDLGVIPAICLAGWAWTAWLIPRRVRAIGYVERETDLIVRKGILFRTLAVVPYGRLQYLDVGAGPLYRAFGLARLKLNTAANGLTAILPGLEADEAARLRDRLAELGDARMAGL
jgi:membrane protein YdbS with pleckstrin-like domain